MKTRQTRFNTYLLLALCGAASGAGCKTGDANATPDTADKPRHDKNETCVLRLHLEVSPDGTDRNGPVTIGRQSPFSVNVERDFFLAEIRLARAELVEDGLSGFQIQVHYDRKGAWLLEQYTTAHKGSRIAIFSEFGEVRWLGAPRITQRITDGVFTFTPDASREEAEHIVHTLRNTIKKERGKNTLREPAPK